MVVLITGGSRGIGAQTVLKFAKNGYNVAINYYNDIESAKKIKSQALKYGVKVEIYKCDVSNEKDVKNMIDNIILEFGQIDCLVNNAGIALDTLPLEKEIDNFKRILDVNLLGVYLVSKYAGSAMKNGTIINISSTNAIDTYYPYSLDYDASKAGVISLTHNFSIMYSPNIRVNAVAPGWVNTDMNKDMDLEFIEKESEKITLKRFAEPEEIANVVYFLASKEASYINNSVIRVDGGLYGSF